MTNSVWDDPDLRVGGDFVKFDAAGDSISGRIDTIRTHRFDNGKVAPQLLLTTDDGDERTVTAGQIQLKVALAEKRPEPGDHIAITMTGIEKRAGGKTLKLFSVAVTPAGQKPAPAATPAVAPAAPAAEAPAVDSGALAAAVSALSPEQRKALGL